MISPVPPEPPDVLDALVRFVEGYRRLFVLTGAGCSTDSGIPDYRDADGNWKHRRPVMYQEFRNRERVRQRYWARSLVGWPRVAQALPNASHRALARLEETGYVRQLVTQNVDRLHQRAGSRRVIDLHGRLDRVECLDCGAHSSRHDFQRLLEIHNPRFSASAVANAPDGDAQLAETDYSCFHVPSCVCCGGLLKPGVVFFGENVPASIVQRGYASLAESDAVLVVGSSLMVYSGYRFCRAAVEQGKPIAAINLGRTRADAELALKIERPCGEVLMHLLDRLALSPG